MVAIARLSSLATRPAAILPLLAALSACATAGATRSAGRSGDSERVAERGPRVQLWTTDEFGSADRVRASFRLEDDAYVIVVNVGLDGFANVIFPDSPEDDGFVRGGRTYRLPSFFPGFASHFRSTYGRLYNATSTYDGVYDRYAGYVFIIASWRPMRFEDAEAAGLWDDYRLAAHETRLEPYSVMHRFAERLVPGGARHYTARYARYAAFRGGFRRASSFASCLTYGSFLGDVPWWVVSTLGSSWIPAYGVGFYGLDGPYCGYRFASTRIRFRPPVRPIVVNPPVRPTPNPGPRDTVARPRGERPPRRPRAEPDTARRRPPRLAEEETVIDLTRDDRARARRGDRAWDRTQRALREERDDVPIDRARTDRHATSRRERARADRDDGVRHDTERSEPRTSEPRREPAARAEPRAEPRSDPRPQPAPRSDPPPRHEPRSERPAKPDRPE